MRAAFPEIKPSPEPIVAILEPGRCVSDCEGNPCISLCPAGVFQPGKDGLLLRPEYCLECGACELGCPLGNIAWHLPKPAYGVVFRMG
ncbi:MAG: 4Fe-4S dicluster domain-containing protein [Firmicutes bacterium]|nr:4Fe-4S dicluster domain-containing protein [Bacillota bacterium]